MARRDWGKTCRNKKVPLCVEKRILEYKLNSIVGFIGDGEVHAHECYAFAKKGIQVRAFLPGLLYIYSKLLTRDRIIELLLEPFVREYCPWKPFHGLWQALMGVR
jgi:hypothetical protein